MFLFTLKADEFDLPAFPRTQAFGNWLRWLLFDQGIPFVASRTLASPFWLSGAAVLANVEWFVFGHRLN